MAQFGHILAPRDTFFCKFECALGGLWMELLPLNFLPVGCTGRVKQINACGALRRRLMDLGLVAGTEVKAVRKSLSGDPTLYEIRGAMIALRRDEASKILVERSML
jgi:ferrous iron transport protein A